MHLVTLLYCYLVVILFIEMSSKMCQFVLSVHIIIFFLYYCTSLLLSDVYLLYYCKRYEADKLYVSRANTIFNTIFLLLIGKVKLVTFILKHLYIYRTSLCDSL